MIETSSSPALAVSDISKQYPGTRALDAVSLELRRGEVHALCGGNGCGKSTLIKVIAGVLDAEAGGTLVVGSAATPSESWSADVAGANGIRVVHQDLGVFADLSVEENLSIGRGFETRAGTVRWQQVRRRAERLIERFEIAAEPRTTLGTLGRATQTQVAIARALQDQDGTEGGVLILDEPTAALPAHEAQLLLNAIRRYAGTGVTVLFVSHRLDEVLQVCDRVTVMRDGRVAGTHAAEDLDEGSLIELIVGRSIDRVFPEMPPVTATAPLVEVEDLWAGPLRGVDLAVRPGEVVGVAGLLGSGRSELLRAIFGDLAIDRGRVLLEGGPVAFRGQADAIAAGIAFVPESRAESVFDDLPIWQNLAPLVLGQYVRGARLRDRRMRQDARELLQRYGVKAASETVPLSSLSGGNQQKVVLARWLRTDPKLLLLDEPTQGVDVGARADIYELVRSAVSRGAAALVVTSDMEEMARVVDRAIVLRGGRAIHQVSGAELTPERLTELSYEEIPTHV